MQQPAEWKLRFAPNIGLNSLDTPMFRGCVGGLDPVLHVDFIADQGFAGVEDNFLTLREPVEQAAIGAALSRRGLAMGCFVANPASWNKPLWVSTASDARATLDADLDTCIAAAARCGGQVLTVITGFDPHVPRAFQFAAMTENLRRLAPAAEKAGVIMGIEACNSYEYPMLFMNDVRDAYAMAVAVDSPAVGIVFDIYHVQMMQGDVMRNLERSWDRIVAIQCADNPGRAEPGSGELNWANVFRLIKSKGYTGLVELEHELSGPGKEGELVALERLRTINQAI